MDGALNRYSAFVETRAPGATGAYSPAHVYVYATCRKDAHLRAVETMHGRDYETRFSWIQGKPDDSCLCPSCAHGTNRALPLAAHFGGRLTGNFGQLTG